MNKQVKLYDMKRTFNQDKVGGNNFFVKNIPPRKNNV